MEDKYIERKLKPIIEDLKAVWKLDDEDEWLIDFKETIETIMNKVYEDGFVDGTNEGNLK